MALGRKTGGRTAGTPNKRASELKAYAGKFTEEAINGLLAIAREDKMPPQARVGAWKEILDRAVGKAPQAHVDGDGNNLTVPQVLTFIMQQSPGSENRS